MTARIIIAKSITGRVGNRQKLYLGDSMQSHAAVFLAHRHPAMFSFPDGLAEAIAAVKSSNVELNIKVDKIRNLLLNGQVAYYHHERPDAFLVHPANRGGLMVNAFDVHRKGSTMLKIGVQLSKLNEAVAFGISFDPCKRLTQFDLNKGLVESSQGMLAPVTGSERFLTVGSSHTVAFCRAVNSGCRTTIPELSSNGFLSLSHILHGKEEGHPLKEMCIEGWKLLIIPSWVEDRVPDLTEH